MATDNPARVLYETLERGLRSAQNAEIPALRVWADAFGLEGPELARKLSRMQQLPQAVRATVTRLGIDPVPVDRAMARIEVAGLEHLHSTWQNFWTQLGAEGALDFVQMTASYIDAASTAEDSYPIDDVDGLLSQLQQLREEIAESDLPDDLKKLVDDRLVELLDELHNLDVSTTIYFRGLVEGLVGLLATFDTLYAAMRNSVAGRAVLETLAALIVVHGVSGTPASPLVELGPPKHAIVKCLDPKRIPALPSGSEDETVTPPIVEGG
jgi:hypothetical protein